MTIVRLKQRDLFTKRWRNVTTLDPGELALHIALVARLRRELCDDVIMYHVPNGEHRDNRTAAKLKAMGVLPGVADLVFNWPGGFLYLELKAPDRTLSAAQRKFKARVELFGGRHYAVAHSINEAISILHQNALLKSSGDYNAEDYGRAVE